MGKLRALDVALLILGIGVMSTSKILNYPGAFFNSYWPGLLGLMVASSGLIQNQAMVHADKISRNISPVHWKANLLRIVVAIALCTVLNLGNFHLAKVITMLLFSSCWVGLWFNLELNIARHLPMFYLTKEKAHASITDRMFHNFKYGGEVLASLQVIGMIITGYIYCIK